MHKRLFPNDVAEISELIRAEVHGLKMAVTNYEGGYVQIRDEGIQQTGFFQKEEQEAELFQMDYSGRMRDIDQENHCFRAEIEEDEYKTSRRFDDGMKQDVLEGSTQNMQEECMLSDPQRPCQQPYDCLSVEDESECPVVACINQPAEQHPSKQPTTPSKASTTEISTEPMLPSYAEETREDKLRRFQLKRKNRNWNRKVYYDCRKKVADSRLRIKGRFITRVQAQQILGMPIKDLALEHVKVLLEKHFDSKQPHKS